MVICKNINIEFFSNIVVIFLGNYIDNSSFYLQIEIIKTVLI